MGEEGNTIAAIFPSWSRDNNRVNAMANAEMQKTIAETNQFVSTVNQYIDDSDRSTQGMSDMLRRRQSSSTRVRENTQGPQTTWRVR